MNWSRLFLASSLGLLLMSDGALANDSVDFCNRGSQTVLIATANNYWRGGEELWKESGWYEAAAGRCIVLRGVRPFHTVGYAFLISDGRKFYNPVASGSSHGGLSPLNTSNLPSAMCVNREEEFAHHAKSKAEVGARCASTLKLSYFLKGGSRNQNNILKLVPDDYLVEGNEIWQAAEAQATDATEDIGQFRHKHILAAYLTQVYNRRGGQRIDASRVALDDERIAGTSEMDGLHGMLNQQLDYLDCGYIGATKRFKDKWELRDAMLHGYGYDDDTYKPLPVTAFGRELIDELALVMKLDLGDAGLTIPHAEVKQGCARPTVALSELTEGQRSVLQGIKDNPGLREAYLRRWGVNLAR